MPEREIALDRQSLGAEGVEGLHEGRADLAGRQLLAKSCSERRERRASTARGPRLRYPEGGTGFVAERSRIPLELDGLTETTAHRMGNRLGNEEHLPWTKTKVVAVDNPLRLARQREEEAPARALTVDADGALRYPLVLSHVAEVDAT